MNTEHKNGALEPVDLEAPWPNGEIRLWDSQWVNIVTADCASPGHERDCILAIALTEQAMRKNYEAELTARRARAAEVEALVAEHSQWAESFGAACVCALQGDFQPIENLARCMPIHFPDGAPILRSDPLAPFTGTKP